MAFQDRTKRRTAVRAATREQGPPSCRCTRRHGLVADRTLTVTGPTVVATFRPRRPGGDAELVDVVHRHVCGRPDEHLDPAAWSRR